MRDFEKISFAEFAKDIKDDKELYDNYELPSRSNEYTAGYDFHLIEDITIKPGEIIKIPTGIRSYFEKDEALLLIIRSSTGFKYNIRMVNQVGLIDSDYYHNPDNEGHMYVKVQNEGTETVTFKKGDSLAQGVFIKYLTTKSDIKRNVQRRAKY